MTTKLQTKNSLIRGILGGFLLFGSFTALQAQQKVGATLDGNFNTDGNFGQWSVQSTGSSGTVSGGYLNATMGLQTNSKYRADIWYNFSSVATNDMTLNTTNHAYLAIKFKGSRPDGSIKLELQRNAGGTIVWDNTVWNGGSADGNFTDTNGDIVYYFNLTKDPDFTGGDLTYRRIHILVADAVINTSYQVDWIASFADTAAIQAYMSSSLGINKVGKENKKLALYPNPSTGGSFTIQLDANTLEPTVSIKIYQMNGSLVKEIKQDIDTETIQIQHGLPKGAYLLQVNGGASSKLIVD